MSSESTGDTKFWDNLKNAGLIFSLFLSLGAILLTLINVQLSLGDFWARIQKHFTTDNVQLWINIGNIGASVFFLVLLSLRSKISDKYLIKWDDKEYDFCELAELYREGKNKPIPKQSISDLTGYEIRVDKLVKQYLWLIRIFAMSLAILYLTIIISSLPAAQRPPADVPSEVVSKPDYRGLTGFAMTVNVLNFSGGVVIFLAFWVLYGGTLDGENNTKVVWLVLPVFLAFLYGFILLLLSWLFVPGENAYKFLNRYDLLSGAVNGLGMFLLFGRYVSLDQSLRKTVLFNNSFRDLFRPFRRVFQSDTERPYTKAVSFAIVFLLPIYALAQPLFGSLNIKLYGEDPKVFQNAVYGICLVGKICFFYVTYLLVRKKLLHLYLYGLVSQVGNFPELEKCLHAVPSAKG